LYNTCVGISVCIAYARVHVQCSRVVMIGGLFLSLEFNFLFSVEVLDHEDGLSPESFANVTVGLVGAV